ncbi:carbohydrate-binding protein, partial [Planktothrix serta]|uniref:hypothetical protein n=1 Tax=Planktothrix serta TaxID=1678310 RepID=UPI0018CC0826
EASQVSDTSDNTVVSSSLDTFNINVQSSPPPASKVRVEAENMTLAGYKIESGTFASAGKFIGLSSPNTTGNATQAFSGVSGLYDIVVGYFDENDGISPFSVSVAGNTVSQWTAAQSLGDTRASATTLTSKTISGVNLTQGDEIKLTGTLERGENGRFDYVEFIPVTTPTPDTTAPTATATANDTTLNLGSNNSYTFTVTYSDNQAVKVSSLDSQDVRVTGPNGF